MDSNVLLTINGRQWSGHEEPQLIRLTTEGQLLRLKKFWSIVYDESDATGMEGTRTTIQVEDEGSMILTRTGSHEMRLSFEAGSRHITRMNTPYGDLDVSVFTSMVESQIDDSGGFIHLGYTIDINNQEQLNTRLDIEIKKSVV
ncbi:MAG: DUF1934 domain-containing protein [Eubacteriales bacterium]|nr:DUF1934 domain-containing protein [Eubacteriales bacterium]